MQSFQKTITVTKDDLDELNHVNNVRYVQWIQDVAKDHWESRASKAIRENYFWVVLEHHIKYKGAALLDDEVLLKTYVKESAGITSLRIVEMFNATTNKLLVQAETKWCFCDIKTKKPTRITQETIELFH